MNDDQGLFLQHNAVDTLLRNSSSLQVLKNMGFPKERALKALAATGDAGVQVACDWIFAHVKDPMLDKIEPREFILYACPAGPFGLKLEEFWQESLLKCGRNGVHNSFPHVTLCSFFKCKDEGVSNLVRATTKACQRACNEADSYKFALEYFSTQNYIGLFLEEKAAGFLRKLSDYFAEEAEKISGTKVVSHSNKQLHITLAYKFPPNHFKELEKLAKQIDLNKPSTWEIRLYSKDPSFGDCETLRVLYPYSPTSNTESHLQLINGDCIFVGQSNEGELPKFEGWFFGTSWMTGCSGFFPATHTEKSTDTDTWTIHKKYVLMSKSSSSTPEVKLGRRYTKGADEFHTTGYSSAQALMQQDINDQQTTSEPKVEASEPVSKPPDLYAQVNKTRNVVSVTPSLSQKARRIYIFRHAERVDVTFGKDWTTLSFDDKGQYHRKNLNMPSKLPVRPGGPSDFHKDSPITEMGSHQAYLTGQALKDLGVDIQHAFSSPSLRCLQTATSILKGMHLSKDLKIKIDLGLYEWMKWSPGGLPKFMSCKNLQTFGINVNPTYSPIIQPSEMAQNERCTDYFKRCHRFLNSVLTSTTGDILICGHAGSLDGLSRQIQGLSPRPMPEFVGIVTKVPYCGSIVLEEEKNIGIYQIIEPPYPTLTHAPNPRFDWKMMLQ